VVGKLSPLRQREMLNPMKLLSCWLPQLDRAFSTER